MEQLSCSVKEGAGLVGITIEEAEAIRDEVGEINAMEEGLRIARLLLLLLILLLLLLMKGLDMLVDNETLGDTREEEEEDEEDEDGEEGKSRVESTDSDVRTRFFCGFSLDALD